MKRAWSQTSNATAELTRGELSRAARRQAMQEAPSGAKLAALLSEAAQIGAAVATIDETTNKKKAAADDELNELTAALGGLSLSLGMGGTELKRAPEEELEEEQTLLKQVREIELDAEVDVLLADERVRRVADAIVEDVVRDMAFCAKATVPLTTAEEREADKVIKSASPNGREDLAVLDNVPVQGKDLCLLRDGTWLNDEIVNFSMKMLQHRNRRYIDAGLKVPRCYFFNSFLLAKLAQLGYQNGVRRWSKRAKIKVLEMDRVIIPYNISNTHWTLTCIDVAKKRLIYLDSLGGGGHTAFDLLRQYVQGEADTYSPELGIDASSWETVREAVPRQNNGCDCGVFTIMFAETLAEDRPFDWSQADMPYFRRRIALNIMRKTWF